MDLRERADRITAITQEAGELAKTFFSNQAQLRVDKKGHQDFVSQADRDVETLVRKRLGEVFPQDAIVGEEHEPTPGTSGFTWVIDPIDGTTNFINAIPAWTVVIAGVQHRRTEIGVIHDPCNSETFTAVAGEGATLNGAVQKLTADLGIRDGSIGVGMSNRVGITGVTELVAEIMKAGGMFHRNASGALSLAYVAAGRLLGYSEEHMNAWDCLAGQLLIREAGGLVEDQDADQMIADGGRVVVGAPGVFDDLLRISETAFGD